MDFGNTSYTAGETVTATDANAVKLVAAFVDTMKAAGQTYADTINQNFEGISDTDVTAAFYDESVQTALKTTLEDVENEVKQYTQAIVTLVEELATYILDKISTAEGTVATNLNTANTSLESNDSGAGSTTA